MASRVAREAERYSASAVDKATTDCRLTFQVIAAPAKMKTKPDTDFRSWGSLAQSASQNPIGRGSDEEAFEYVRARDFVPRR